MDTLKKIYGFWNPKTNTQTKNRKLPMQLKISHADCQSVQKKHVQLNN